LSSYHVGKKGCQIQINPKSQISYQNDHIASKMLKKQTRPIDDALEPDEK